MNTAEGQDREVRASVKVWREDLVGLNRRSPLLNFKARKNSSLKMKPNGSDTTDSLYEQIRTKHDLDITSIDQENDENYQNVNPEDNRVIYSSESSDQIALTLRKLSQKAKEEYLNKGIDILYVAFGVLKWRGIDKTQYNSPLLFIPVKIVTDTNSPKPRLLATDNDPQLNTALFLQLKQLGASIDIDPAKFEAISPSEIQNRVLNQLRKYPDIVVDSIEDVAYLATFTFQKEAIYQDLLEHEEEIVNHPIVRALGTSDPLKQSDEFSFDPVETERIDDVAEPESIPLILDADSSQRVAISAALAGKTFIMDGPPGTGKSQTIANMIGALLHAGKTVLFVSEKIAALDVVKNRLSTAGLESYILQLHSHQTTRKEVATELLKTLDNIVCPPKSLSRESKRLAKQRRIELSGYSLAMNSRRMPLNISVHEAIGKYSQLKELAGTPAPSKSVTNLSEKEYTQIEQALEQLARSWRPVLEGENFIWRGVLETEPLDQKVINAQNQLRRLRNELYKHSRLTELFKATRPSATSDLISLLRHNREDHCAHIPDNWITQNDLTTVEAARDRLAKLLTAVNSAVSNLETLSRTTRKYFPPHSTIPENQALPTDLKFPQRANPLKYTTLTDAAQRYTEFSSLLRENWKVLQSVSRNLDGPEIDTFDEIASLKDLIALSGRSNLPEKHWLSTQHLHEVKSHIEELKDSLHALEVSEDTATQIYTTEALNAPLSELQDRFNNIHSQFLGKLRSSYRADKQTVKLIVTDPSLVKDGMSSLDKAIAWNSAYDHYTELSKSSSSVLGHYWNGRDTDFQAISSAVQTAERALEISGGRLSRKMSSFLSGEYQNSSYRTVVEAAALEIDNWKHSVLDDGALNPPPQLLLMSVSEAVFWFDAHSSYFSDTADRVHVVNTAAGGDYTVNEVERILTALNSVEESESMLAEEIPTLSRELGSFLDRSDPDLESIDHNLRWVRRLRTINGGRMDLDQYRALQESSGEEDLSAVYSQWQAGFNDLIDSFDVDRKADLRRRLDDFDTASDILNKLIDDTSGQNEWLDYSSARNTLSVYGLSNAVDYCIETLADPSLVPDAIRRSVLKSWIDRTISRDDRLRPLRADAHDSYVEEFKKLDSELITSAASEIIKAANSLRPKNTEVGAAGVIRKQGMKGKNHLPVHELLANTVDVTSKIKPIFMMSPIAVSQYLPSNFRFDVVIFDEASQVTPADAINSIYRGNSLILAGDDKQLPPMSFFERNTEVDGDDETTDVGDFQSVLELAKSAGAFKNLGLRWHYRSRHEDLIAFSNYKFYKGDLITFPSAKMEGEDVGVDFINARGTYRQGAGQDNPIEAKKVAERVVHHFIVRPEETLGVVTFSVRQEDAVRNAIEMEVKDHPSIASRIDSDDRLNGFFVRSLEKVQGDERDVIIFSVGYGPNEAGRIYTRFGALNNDKGWRRLNVGITRARKRIEVVASMYAEEIPPSKNENVEFLRQYLEYAAKGSSVLAPLHSSTGLAPESPFEESVIQCIRSWGYTVEPQIGAAGYRIDMGVRHPEYPGMFAIGIECDGYQYHSAPAARDRDRLREGILTGLGWRLHRIWGTSWYRDRKTETARLKKAIEEAVELGTLTIEPPVPATSAPDVQFTHVPLSSTADWSEEYKKALPKSLPDYVSPGAEGSHTYMVPVIEHLVENEGPIHMDIVRERLRKWWSISRIGSKIKNNIDLAVENSSALMDGPFLRVSGKVPVARRPGDGVHRKLDQVHSDEIAAAVVKIVDDVRAVERDELVKNVIMLFGWANSHSSSLVVNEVVDSCIEADRITERGSMLITL